MWQTKKTRISTFFIHLLSNLFYNILVVSMNLLFSFLQWCAGVTRQTVRNLYQRAFRGGIDMEKGRNLPDQPETGSGRSSHSVVTFKDTRWADHTADIVDLTDSSVRVESDRPIDPGFVWFNDRVRGHKGGLVVWCQPFYGRYRAVMQLVPLTRDEERLIQERTVRSGSHRSHRSPEEIIATLTKSMKRKRS
jgi:hypothetical protein